jgi:tight adherence protein B
MNGAAGGAPMTSVAAILGCALLVLAVLVWPGARRRPPPAVRASAGRVAGAGVGLRPRARPERWLPRRSGGSSEWGTGPGPDRWLARRSRGSSEWGTGPGLDRWPDRWPGRWVSRWVSRCWRWRHRSADGPGGPAGRAIAVVEALATQVRAGASPEAAWQLALELVDGRRPDDPTQMAASGPGREEESDSAWRALGAAWRLSEETGAPLANVLDRLAAGLRQELEVEAEVEASLAAPRATARLLAGLPLVGVALGELIGARPVGVLLGTALGRGCALAGLLLAAAGQVWTRALVARVVRAARAG